ncbi:ATP-binding region, ATPase-like protein [Endozoicomonas montiporae CL-33]|uniref:histidine kinase n=2 Tax=Endozoicomonas montiporae TaxID=1027273 RepID=A0A142BCM4_9GAMM|nr:ATP-binding region, ATPase-like protein [Endozoicomonas montiporae CL-33]
MAELLAESRLDKTQHRYVNTMQESGESLLKILDDILDHSRLTTGKLTINHEPFSPHKVVQHTVRMFEPAAKKKGLELDFAISPEIPASISGDATRVQQVLINLLSNAIKFTDSGFVYVSAQRISAEKKPFLIISVRDTGPCINPNEQEYLFKSFAQGSRTRFQDSEGSGLGLSIAKQLVTLMGGEVGLENQTVGSTFWFTLPLN